MGEVIIVAAFWLMLSAVCWPIGAALREAGRTEVRISKRCKACDYDLCGHEGETVRCPECGRLASAERHVSRSYFVGTLLLAAPSALLLVTLACVALYTLIASLRVLG